MKTKILFFLTILSLVGCSKDDPIVEDPLAKLPPETQVGDNTFGCIINNQVFYPRDGTSTLFSPGSSGLILWGDPSSPTGLGNYLEIEIRNLKDGIPCSKMLIHLQNLPQIQTGEYMWKVSNFQSSIDGLMQNYVYAKIFDVSSNSWKLYSSYENSGKIIVTKFNSIFSGNFSGKLRLRNGTDEIEIINGRFDIGPGLGDKIFP